MEAKIILDLKAMVTVHDRYGFQRNETGWITTAKKPESVDQPPIEPNPPEVEEPKGTEEKEENPEEESSENCECCQLLRENSTPVVTYVNVSKSDMILDRTLCVFKLESSSKEKEESSSTPESYPPPVPPKVKRQLDRFEESKIWDLIGLTQKMYAKLEVELKKVSNTKLVFKKSPYRLHNTRHFQVPLVKKGVVTKENVQKQKYEDDRKLLKKNQAFDCQWNECPHSFQDPQDMRIHYMFDHESVRLFCCGNRYENYDSYLEHYVTTMNGEGHSTWMARECWGCGIRYVDAKVFYEHANHCVAQINPFTCPDPLCGIRFEVVTDIIDHFFIWHDPAGAIVCNEVVYKDRMSIEKDLPLLDDCQLAINYPLRATYTCQLCHISFAADKYYHEHVISHVKNPHLWLVPTILFCVSCQTKNCRYQREKLIELLPKVIHAARRITVEDCTKNPVFLIWRLFLSEEFIQTMEMILIRLYAEHNRLLEEEETKMEKNEQKDHPLCEEKRLCYILNSLYFLFTVPYRSERPLITDEGVVLPIVTVKKGEDGDTVTVANVVE
uniref:C2H2-type domain-containing protein n=1 Tax=Caenorhabditis tropicalis TaxID=1561998 RepID=A0A1I7UF88_9PELO